MTTTVEMEGNSVDEAVQAALDQLGIERSNAKIEVLEEEKNRGFFGRKGSGKAKVRVTVIEEANSEGIEKAVSLVKGILDNMNLEGHVELFENDDNIEISVSGPDLGLLIGKHGETLSAIQSIASVVLKKDNIEKKLVVDVENYRQRRAERLKEIALQVAERVVRTGREEALKPMNSYDRRVVHLALKENDMVQTTSEGVEPDRKVVIAPVK